MGQTKETSNGLGTQLKENEAKKDGIISKRSNFDTQLEAFNIKLNELNQMLSAGSTASETSTQTANNETAKKAASSAANAKSSVSDLNSKVSELKNSSVLDKLSEEDKKALLAEIDEVDSAASDVENNVDETYTNAQKAADTKTTAKTQSASSEQQQ